MIIILDWDGTIVDSAGRIVETMQAAAEACGLAPLTDEAIRHIIGLGLPEAIRTLYPGIDDHNLEQMRQRYSEYYRDPAHPPAAFFPGVMDTLERLLGEDCLLAVATGKSRRGLDRELHLREMAEMFHVTRCADETASKPHPRMLHEILHEAGRDKERAVMVGDTLFDMEMADRAGMRKVAVSYGAHSAEKLESSAPDLLVDEFSTILDWVVALDR